MVKVSPYAAPMMALDKGMSAATGILGTTLEALSTDLIVLRGRVQRGTKKKPKTPIEWEIHGNMVGGCLLVVGAGVFLYLADLRIGPYSDTIIYGHWTWTYPDTMRPNCQINGPTIQWRTGEQESLKVPDPYTFPEIAGHWEYGVPGHWGMDQYGYRIWIEATPDVWHNGYQQRTVDAVLAIDGNTTEKRWGLQVRYHEDTQKTEDIIYDYLGSPFISWPIWLAKKLSGK
jgi:hypothetical protein